jgi:hypothetical protein
MTLKTPTKLVSAKQFVPTASTMLVRRLRASYWKVMSGLLGYFAPRQVPVWESIVQMTRHDPITFS